MRCIYKFCFIFVYFKINIVYYLIFYFDFIGSMSFFVNRSKIEFKKFLKKIGNLFLDVWKKGNEYDFKVKLIFVFFDVCFVLELCNDRFFVYKLLVVIFFIFFKVSFVFLFE